ncbi:AIPR family protein, partial [bacterium]|nr:AIPR family protein [bacterium]
MTYTNEFELLADRENKIEEYFDEMELTFSNEISDNIRDQKNIFIVDLSGEEVVQEKTYFACLVKQNNDEIDDPIKKFEEVLKNGELSENFSKIKEIYILVLTDSIKEEQLYTETLNKKSYKVKLEKILQNKIIHFTARSVIHKDSNLSCTVRITNRIQTAIPSVTSKLTSNTKGRIYTAKLCDLVELYTLTGNELFRSNLRIGLEDLLSVDTEIKTTLKHNPEEFWFLNNGITLILPKQSVDQSSFDSIKLNNLYSDDKVLNASVINGAQTITASSGFFLNLKKEYTEDEIEEAKNKAEVILRVITYEENFDEHLATSSLINKVTVALNRQKPIKGQDIALVTPFVLSIGELKKEITNSNNINVFSFIRRGEAISNENHQYDLSNIVKIFKAVLEQNPSAIKSIKDDVLLKIDDTTKNFSNSAMFNQFLTLENYENNHGQFI